MERKTEWQWEGVRERRDEENEGRTVREKKCRRKKNRENREMASSGKVTLFFLSFRYYRCLLSFLPTTWATFVVFVMLGHLELCWFWLDYTFVVVDTSFVLFGMVRFNWSLFRFHYVAYVALIYLIPPQVLFTSLSPWIETWDMAFCWFIFFPPLVLCFFFPLFLVLITSTTQTNFSSPSAHFPINPLPHPSLSSFLSTFSRAGNLGRAWPPCPRQPRHSTRSYSLASRRVHACPAANTL